jgi:serine/threonine protein kinase
MEQKENQDNQKVNRLNNYIITKSLGSGLNCKVKLGKDANTGMDVAIKIMKGGEREQSNTKAMKNEYDVLLQLNHPNVIRLLELNTEGVYTKKDGKVKSGTVYAALELASNGEIFEFLANTGRFSEPVCRYYFKQLIDA